MKVTKRFLTILLSVCLIMSMFSMTAFAAGTASITVQNVAGTNASVEGKTLNLFKIFEATTDGTNIAYNWIKKDGLNLYEEFFLGCTLTVDGVEKVFPRLIPTSVTNPSIHDVVNYIDSLKNNSFEFSQMAAALHEYIHAKGIQADKTSGVIETGKTSYTFSELDLGYYLIYDATTLSTDTPAVRSAAMLAHAGENKVINLKADRPHIEKAVKDDVDADGNAIWKAGTTASVGDIVTFRIATMIPDHDLYGAQYVFNISDVMSDGLVLDLANGQTIEDVVEVWIKVPGAEQSTLMTTGYDIITEDLTEQEKLEGVDFKIVFTNVTDLLKDSLIEIIYDAKVTNNGHLESINPNKATLEYSNDPHKVGEGGTTGEVSSTANVLLWQFILTKYMEDSAGAPSFVRLGGAKFSIFESNEQQPLKFAVSTLEISGKSYTVYTLDPTGDIVELETCNSGDDGRTDLGYDTNGGHLGEILIFGLGEGSYVIRETKAPDGYQIAKGDFGFALTDTIGPNGTIGNAVITEATRTETPGQFTRVAVREAIQKYYIGITNRPGQLLPETGGMGSTVYMVAGLAVMACAASILVYKKRSFVR